MRTLPVLFVLAACNGSSEPDSGTPPVTDSETDTPPPTTDPPGMCGDVTEWDVTLSGKVNAVGGGPASGALVHVEERVWDNQVTPYGSTVSTDANGHFEVLLPDVISVEDCWGLMGYYVVATQGANYAEDGINQPLFTAINGGTLVADISAVPLQLAPQ